MDLDHHYRTALDWTPNHIAERPVRVSKKVEAATRCLADSCHVADLLQEECDGPQCLRAAHHMPWSTARITAAA